MSSDVVGKEQCPECAKVGRDQSQDNLILYADGGAHCFACGYHIKGKRSYRGEHRNKKVQVLSIPYNFRPLEKLEFKYNIPAKTLSKCGVFESLWSDKHGEVFEDTPGLVAFTFYDDKLRLIGIKYRDIYGENVPGNDGSVLTKKQSIYVEGTLTLGGLYTCSLLKSEQRNKKTVCIWEGETDWLMAHKVNSTCDHLFIPGSNHVSKIKQYSMLLRHYQTIYIGFDNDMAGDIARDEVKECLPTHKLRFIQYDQYNDLTEWLSDGNDFDTLISRAYSDDEGNLLFGDSFVQHCSNYFEGLARTDILDTGIDSINEMLGGGLTPSEVLLLVANSGVGKSTLCATIADNMRRQGVRSLWIGSEMQPAQMVRKFIELITGERYYRDRKTGEWSISDDERDQIIQELSNDIVFYRQSISDWETLEESILTAIYQYDISVVFIDVLSDYLSTSWETNEKIMQRLSWIASGDENDARPPIPIVCVCHLKEVQGQSYKKVTLNRIVGGKCVQQKPTAVIGMEGDVSSDDPTRIIKVLKASRMNESFIKKATIYFDKQDRCYYDGVQEPEYDEPRDTGNLLQLPRRHRGD